MTTQRSGGFTLIELMITIAIVGILAGIAYPSYKSSVQRSARADAKAVLLENSQWLERNFTTANRYDRDSAGNNLTSASLPAPQAPKEGDARYNIILTVSNASPSTYTLTATPVAGGPQATDKCGSFTLNQAGVKNVTGTAGRAACWNN